MTKKARATFIERYTELAAEKRYLENQMDALKEEVAKEMETAGLRTYKSDLGSLTLSTRSKVTLNETDAATVKDIMNEARFKSKEIEREALESGRAEFSTTKVVSFFELGKEA